MCFPISSLDASSAGSLLPFPVMPRMRSRLPLQSIQSSRRRAISQVLLERNRLLPANEHGIPNHRGLDPPGSCADAHLAVARDRDVARSTLARWVFSDARSCLDSMHD